MLNTLAVQTVNLNKTPLFTILIYVFSLMIIRVATKLAWSYKMCFSFACRSSSKVKNQSRSSNFWTVCGDNFGKFSQKQTTYSSNYRDQISFGLKLNPFFLAML